MQTVQLKPFMYLRRIVKFQLSSFSPPSSFIPSASLPWWRAKLPSDVLPSSWPKKDIKTMARLYGWPLVDRQYIRFYGCCWWRLQRCARIRTDGLYLFYASLGFRMSRGSIRLASIWVASVGNEMLSSPSSSSALDRLYFPFIPRLAMQTPDHFSWQMRKQELEPVTEESRCQSRRGIRWIFLYAAWLCSSTCPLHPEILVS